MFTGGPTSECEAPTQRRPAPRARLALPCTAGLTRARAVLVIWALAAVILTRYRPPMTSRRPSLLQMSAAQRLGLAAAAIAVVWAAVVLALV